MEDPTTKGAGARWLELLLRGVPVEELLRHGQELGSEGARQAGQALQVKALLQERSRRAGELAALNDIAGHLLGMRSPTELLPEIVTRARHLLRVDLAYLALARTDDRGRDCLRIEVTDGALTPELVGVELDLESGVMGWIMRNARPRWSHDYQADTTFVRAPEADAAASAEHMHGTLGAPLTVRGRVIGALFAADRLPRDFSEEEVTLLSALAAHAGIAVDNARRLAQLEATLEELDHRSERLAHALHWDDRLREVVLRGGGITELLAEVSSAVGSPVRFVRHRVGEPDPELPPVSSPVVAAQRVLGWLVLGREEVSEAGRIALDRAAPTVALAAVAHEAATEATGRARDLRLIELVTAPPDAEPRTRELRLAGLDPTGEYSVAVVAGRGAAVTGHPAWVEGLPTEAVVVRHHRDALVVSPGDPEKLAATLRAAGVTAGVAGPVPAERGLPAAHTEASEVLLALKVLDDGPMVATRRHLGIHRLLLTELGRDGLRAEVERELGPVQVEEQQRGVPLLATMQAYLDAGRSPSRAAAALSVHVNTVYQRLAVVDRLLGPEWRQPGRSLDLHVLLRLESGLPTLRPALPTPR
ncbi:PucR C-terminal helix-turn-helix domain-containing protein [Kytococcus aerolatus]|uniref:PucR C-terminal helix-turn-helix domain-containing protein n=2 Tax=Kytococcus aerolatus TaxID=592308 RepID=A0A212TC03_9MICO|nr:PucR C-terminal helix-turn-helix domain-containing protein [Kytococcus aerolatus]